ncbi:2-hydroxyacid dehydrogenase, putative [Ixodes scapularis]|uniref:2-hydroxyacid dehydrogenase, putative n=1 Tax=Ixodes scapularis TaxID=6945 RepID=B7PIX3_IXOSC|nr:2-hydroxyacid dehydrogenase, putative [Ixodes scapularis]|eukprot:XP_002406543.1 2-hydroxyacid dehydrogenase, putative [Ixodes scapularis]
MKPVLINIGRGTIISEESIIEALNNGWISGAILDVFPKEPLPVDSPLWSQPNGTQMSVGPNQDKELPQEDQPVSLPLPASAGFAFLQFSSFLFV